MRTIDSPAKAKIWVLTETRNEYDVGPEMVAWWSKQPTEEQVEKAIIANGDDNHRLNPHELTQLTKDGGTARATFMSWYSHYTYDMAVEEEAD